MVAEGFCAEQLKPSATASARQTVQTVILVIRFQGPFSSQPIIVRVCKLFFRSNHSRVPGCLTQQDEQVFLSLISITVVAHTSCTYLREKRYTSLGGILR